MPVEVYGMIEAPASKRFAQAAEPARAAKNSPLTWLNLVCLDAPLVAVSWAWLFARSFGINVAAGGMCALFLTAWLIYLADRFGDSIRLDPRAPSSLRQRVCLRNAKAWLALVFLVTAADAGVVISQLGARELRVGAVVGTCAVAYLLVNQLRPALWR
ncbi:MAG: hypothetical protein M3Y80_03880, partial [Verrucomicrobiota bacterium]|nr:hypothetical protein [Verrucomicrobiota bacterium]